MSGERRSSRPVWLGEDHRQWDHVRVHLQVLRDARIDAYGLAIYLGLAAHAEITTGAARPSIETLASYGGMSPRKAASVVAELIAAGYVSVEHRAGKASRYSLLPPPPLHEVHGSEADPGTVCAAPLHLVPTTPAPGADEQEPVTENHGPEELLVVADAPTADAFEAFWAVYPKGRGTKKAARERWPAAVRAAGNVTVIVEAARRYAADPNLPEPMYIPHAQKWLKEEYWTLGPLSPRRGRRAPAQQIIEQRDGKTGRIEL